MTTDPGRPPLAPPAPAAPAVAVAAPGAAPSSTPVAHPPPTHRHGWWWKALLVGLGLWGIAIGVTMVTHNSNLIPTLILIGSFLVPICVMLFVAERIRGNFTTTTLILLFFLSGLFGVLGASLLEAPLNRQLWALLVVGVIEETLKLVILVIAGWRFVPKTAGQGALLGATVGAGFAAFESAGYAFNAALTAGGIDLISLLQTAVIRAAVSPVGHVLWTAILGAVLLGTSRDRSHYRVTLGLLGALIGVSLLHGLWDAMRGLAVYIALVATGNLGTLQRLGGLPLAAVSLVTGLAIAVYIVGLGLVTLLGLLFLLLVVRRRPSAPIGPPQAAAQSTAESPTQSLTQSPGGTP